MRPTAITGASIAAFTARALSISSPGTSGAYESVGPVAEPGSWYADTCTASAPAATARRATDDAVVEGGAVGPVLGGVQPAPDREVVAHPADGSPAGSPPAGAPGARPDPPYSSVRWFFAGERKPSMR